MHTKSAVSVQRQQMERLPVLVSLKLGDIPYNSFDNDEALAIHNNLEPQFTW